jgi:hypothetical protein
MLLQLLGDNCIVMYIKIIHLRGQKIQFTIISIVMQYQNHLLIELINWSRIDINLKPVKCIWCFFCINVIVTTWCHMSGIYETWLEMSIKENLGKFFYSSQCIPFVLVNKKTLSAWFMNWKSSQKKLSIFFAF